METEISVPREAFDERGRIVVDFSLHSTPAHWLEPEDYKIVAYEGEDEVIIRVEIPPCPFRVIGEEGWVCTYGRRLALWEDGYRQELHCAWCAIYTPIEEGFD